MKIGFSAKDERRETLKQDFPKGYQKLKKNTRRNFGTTVTTIPPDAPEVEKDLIKEIRDFHETSEQMTKYQIKIDGDLIINHNQKQLAESLT